MRIAYIGLKGMPLGGGIEKYTEEVGSRLVEKGHQVIVYAMRHFGARDGNYRGMEVKTLPAIKARSLEKLTATFLASICQILEKKTEIVHFHAFGPSMFSMIPRLAGKKVVVQGHGIEWKRKKWGPGGRLFLWLSEIPSVRFPHIVTVVSEVQREYILRKYGIKSVYIPSGVNDPQMEAPDLIRKFGLKGNDFILFASRLVREKGAHYIIKAYKMLRTDMKLVIAGDADYEDKYKSELYRLAGGNGNIIFTGFARDKLLLELLSNCYLFVHPSEIEGLPIVLLEAMSYGNCCLASDIPENIEAMNGFGYTFKNKDVQDLSKKLNQLIKDENEANSVKEDAKRCVLEKYSWDAVANEFEKLYLGL